jgi:hypothetical protein
MAGERPANHYPAGPVMLYERDLLRPHDAVDLAGRTRVGLLGTLGVLEHHQREIETDRLHRERTLIRGRGDRIAPIG